MFFSVGSLNKIGRHHAIYATPFLCVNDNRKVVFNPFVNKNRNATCYVCVFSSCVNDNRNVFLKLFLYENKQVTWYKGFICLCGNGIRNVCFAQFLME
jgi:hypothetical protein